MALKGTISHSVIFEIFFFQILTGVGFAICVSCMFQSMVDMAVITWSSKAFYLLFTDQSFAENFFFGSVLDMQDEIALDNLGVLHSNISTSLSYDLNFDYLISWAIIKPILLCNTSKYILSSLVAHFAGDHR